jgi:hypothetical protein
MVWRFVNSLRRFTNNCALLLRAEAFLHFGEGIA